MGVTATACVGVAIEAAAEVEVGLGVLGAAVGSAETGVGAESIETNRPQADASKVIMNARGNMSNRKRMSIFLGVVRG